MLWRTAVLLFAYISTVMAWLCTGKTNAELIANMARSSIIHADRVERAMCKVDRANYVIDKEDAYQDSPQVIGHGATISAPHMHAYATEHLLPYLHPGARVLDVGSGSWLLGGCLPPSGQVVGIEHIPELVDWSAENLRKDGLAEALDKEEIELVVGDGRLGYEQGGPYDAIHVGAAAPTLPAKLVEQLASPGRMFIPVGTFAQHILHVDKDVNGEVTETRIMDVRYVPLTDRASQR
ncbi:protein-L-isoaspartate O-methyltransferase [Desarmillaria tabescens]|uniref:Protein-L-isoaspartate O-methyltransferase n=1 Tax=Armillaria tabescens TaxID=1929756 RepID=A0AA39JVR6_ARMTA|nr:protein-L-isoaspartate O-methyltransferase [Desarmillaria tabescens]KAK0449827.1 protein-L-isoaspartate O-methyltransferase [Desarmillaria tabescens]